MKGSPLLSTITAILLMVGAYLILDLTLVKPAQINKLSSSVTANIEARKPINTINTYLEAHFSTPPTNFIITEPVTGRIIANISNLSENEWVDEISIPINDSLELRVYATWKENSISDNLQQNFIQLVISPDQMDDSSVTLRSNGEIDTTANFTLRK